MEDRGVGSRHIYELACFSWNDSLEKSSLTYPYHGRTTRHTLDWRHAEVFIDWDIDSRCRSSDKLYERVIIWRLECVDMGSILDFFQDFSLHGVVFSIGQDEVLFGHLEKCRDNHIDTFRWRESSKGEKIVLKVSMFQFFRICGYLTVCRYKTTRVRRWINYLARIASEFFETFFYIFRVRDDGIHL